MLDSNWPLPHKCQPPYPLLDNIRVIVIVWRLRGNIIRTASVSSTLILAFPTGPTDWVCHIGTFTPCMRLPGVALAAKYHIEPHDVVRSSVARIQDSFWFYFSELV